MLTCRVFEPTRHGAPSAPEQRTGSVVNFLRQLQAEQPAVFWVLVVVGLLVGFQVVIFVVSLVLGPLGLPSWVPILVVLGGLILVARGQQRSR